MLQSVKHHQLDIEAIQAIGEKYRIGAVITGHLDITNVKPKVRLSSLLTSMSVEADVEASLTARLFGTKDGATLWTDASSGKEAVAHVTMVSNGHAFFGAQDPEKAYGNLVESLVHRITRDFRVRYERR